MQQIHDLAALALGMPRESLEAEIAPGATVQKKLPEPLPVFIQYRTAVPLADGKTGFREDVYERDARMIAALRDSRISSLGSNRKL